MIPAILAPLVKGGLSLLGNAVLVKGKEWLEEKTGVDLSNTNISPEDRVKLQQFQMEHEEELMRIQLENNRLASDEVKAFLGDVDSARKMQTAALGQDDLFSKRFVYYFALMWSAFSMVYIGFITFANIPSTGVRFADTILGFMLGTLVAQIVNYFYGSTKGSKDKTLIMQEAMRK